MALILGHSQVKYLDQYIDSDKVSVLCFPGYKIEDFLDNSSVLEAVEFFSVIVLVVGTNDVSNAEPERTFAKLMGLCEQIHYTNTRATVCVTSILPRTQNNFEGRRLSQEFINRFNDKVSFINAGLRQACSEQDWLSYLELSEFTSADGVNRDMFGRDGLHLSYKGTEELSARVAEASAWYLNLEYTDQQVAKMTNNDVYGPRLYSEVAATSPTQTPGPLKAKVQINVRKRNVYRTQEVNAVNTKRRSVSNKQSGRSVSNKQSGRSVSNKQSGRSVSNKQSGRSVLNTKNRFDGLSVEWVPVPSAETFTPNPVSKPTRQKKRKHNSSQVYVLESEHNFYLSGDNIILSGGGDSQEKSTVYSQTDRILTTNEAVDLLLYPQQDSLTRVPPFRPSAGTVFVYDHTDDPAKKEDWRCDGYTWRNYGRKLFQIDDYVVEKSFFRVKNGNEISGKFQKHSYRFTEKYNNRTVIVYIGNSDEYISMPHGNRKHNHRPHKRTMPSVLNKINEFTDKNPSYIVNKIQSDKNGPKHMEGISYPRNQKQVKNIQSKTRTAAKLSHDSLYSLHLLVDQLDGYILHITTTPDIQVVVGNKEIFEEFNRLLHLKDEDINVYYDTTFCLGDFYVSTLAFQHIMFKEKPSIPIAFMIHERKFQKCHEDFIELIKSKITKLQNKNVCIITDRETAIVNAFEKRLPNSSILICWNHILRDLKFWLNSHGGNSTDKQVYDKHIKSLLHCESEIDFKAKYEELKQIWSEPMVTYFEDHLFDTIVKYSGRWILQQTDNYNPYSGITNNCAESMNAKLKRLVDFKEKDIDTIVLFLYYLQSNDMSDLVGGFCGESELTLLKQFQYALQDPETVDIPKRVCHPDQLIELIKGQVKINTDCRKDTEIHHDDGSNDTETVKREINLSTKTSQKSLAVNVLNDNGIVLVPEMAAFMVKGKSGEKYSVTLFPKEKCNCPATTRCYHIIAAMLSIGMKIPEDKKVMNLTQLRKNCRPRNSKKCGTKKGRKGDRDDDIINPAPDSVMKRNSSPVSEPALNVNSDKKSKKSLRFEHDPTDPCTPKSVKIVTSPKSILKTPKRKIDIDLLPEKNKKHKFEEGENDFVELTELISPRAETNECNDSWIKEFGLNTSHKLLIENNKKLTSEHMEAVNVICREQFMTVSGFQLTEKVPVLIQNENRWNIGSVMTPVSSKYAVQIHHTGRDHWVTSIKYGDIIYLVDSLGSDRPESAIVTPSLQIQLALIYGKNNKNILKICVPDTQRQNNSIDCGLFAIAHAVEFCIHENFNASVIFDTKLMRAHLLNCLENRCFSEFPKTAKCLNTRRKKAMQIIDVHLYCICNLPSCVDFFIKCENCTTVFHRSCVSSPVDGLTAGYLCDNCS